jgi:Putative DNA-binding domain
MPLESLAQLSDLDAQPANRPATTSPTADLESSVFAAAAPSDLQALVDTPCRSLDVEYKSWHNLKHIEDRAELARDIAALANHGGGHIVFGFHEGTLAAEDNHPFWTDCSAEQVATIVRVFLDPPVHCEVVTLRSAIGNNHPVIRVPGHGVVPVCIRHDGPMVGKARLVERGSYYIRGHAAVAQGQYIGVPVPQRPSRNSGGRVLKFGETRESEASPYSWSLRCGPPRPGPSMTGTSCATRAI